MLKLRIAIINPSECGDHSHATGESCWSHCRLWEASFVYITADVAVQPKWIEIWDGPIEEEVGSQPVAIRGS